jgi:hypothetical protein
MDREQREGRELRMHQGRCRRALKALTGFERTNGVNSKVITAGLPTADAGQSAGIDGRLIDFDGSLRTSAERHPHSSAARRCAFKEINHAR